MGKKAGNVCIGVAQGDTSGICNSGDMGHVLPKVSWHMQLQIHRTSVGLPVHVHNFNRKSILSDVGVVGDQFASVR